MPDHSESCKTKLFSRKKKIYIFLLLSQFSWTANYSVQLLAEDGLASEGGKYGIHLKKKY